MAKKKVEEVSIVFCRDCKNSTDYIDNTCYCQCLKKRVCAADNYGRPIKLCSDFYEPKKRNKK